jgi:uncharacterized LabA/DUF88 family protein
MAKFAHHNKSIMDIDFSALIERTGAIKSFYYDCQDENKLPDDYFSGISKVSGSHVRYGTLKGESNKRKGAKQKEVDILLAVDMMNHAIRRNMGEAILLAGDMDFLPVVEALVDMGCFVKVMADKKRPSQELIDAADEFQWITFEHYYSWSSQRIQSSKIPAPGRTGLPPVEQGFTLQKRGKCAGQEVELYYMKGHGAALPTYYVFHPSHSRFSHEPGFHYQHPDIERLELYFKLQFGGIEWE